MSVSKLFHFDKMNKYCFKHLMSSGLILDEDMESVLQNYKINRSRAKETSGYPIFEVILGSISAAASSVLMSDDFASISMSVTAALPIFVIILNKIRGMCRRRDLKSLVERQVLVTKDLIKLNREVLDFLVEQNLRCNDEKFVDSYTSRVQDFVRFLLEEEVALLKELRIYIRSFAALAPFLDVDCSFINQLNMDELMNVPLENYRDCTLSIMKVRDVFLIIISLMLSCWALIFCPYLWLEETDLLGNICFHMIPSVLEVCTMHSEGLTKKFNGVRYHHMQHFTTNRPKLLAKPKFEGDKVLQTTYNTLSMTNEIMDKSLMILEKLEKIKLTASDHQKLEQKLELSALIKGLTIHSEDYHNALDVLSKMYDVSLNARQPASKADLEKKTKEIKVISPAVEDFSDSESETKDEEFEMYFGAGEPGLNATSYDYEDEQEARRLASALSTELKESLKKHGRFAESARKWGVVDDEMKPRETPPQEDVTSSDSCVSSNVTALPPSLCVQSVPILPSECVKQPAALPPSAEDANADDVLFPSTDHIQTAGPNIAQSMPEFSAQREAEPRISQPPTPPPFPDGDVTPAEEDDDPFHNYPANRFLESLIELSRQRQSLGEETFEAQPVNDDNEY